MSGVAAFQRQSLIFCFDLALLRPVFVNPAPDCCAETACIYICSRSCCFGQSIDKTEQLIIPKYSRRAMHRACGGAEPAEGVQVDPVAVGFPPPNPSVCHQAPRSLKKQTSNVCSCGGGANRRFYKSAEERRELENRCDHRLDSSPESASL